MPDRIGALRRLEQLIQEAVVTVPRALIAETIDLVAVLVRPRHRRRLAELARVDGLDPVDGDYRLTPATQTQGDSHDPCPPARHQSRCARCYRAFVMVATATPAHASGSSMPWEAPLQSILESSRGRSPRSSR
jgi:hypothetical protein